jgi:LuxR family transcriptional regulator, maltose regulon positive regulatory protein
MSLAVKSGRPPSHEGLIDRPRLLATLNDARHLPVISVVAPAGYGKTSLLAEWSAQDSRPSVWLACEQWHGDPISLVRALLAPYAAIEPSDVPARGSGRSELNLAPPTLPTLIESLERGSQPLVLILDDVHMLADRPSAEVLATIAEHLPAGSQLLLASRRPVPLPTGRLRAHRALLELGPRELAMSDTEADRLLCLAGVSCAFADTQALVERTEGWPAALYLAALSAAQDPDPQASLAGFSGHCPDIADYLRDEFLDELDAPQREFLTLTSVCARLSGPLCDALLERPDSVEVLDDLLAAGFPLLACERDSYRLHPLLREMLDGELHHADPALATELHLRASDFHAALLDFDKAIDHAVAAHEPRRAGELMWSQLPHYLSQGRLHFVRAHLARFPDEDFADQAPLALTAAYSALALGELRQADHYGLLGAAALARQSEPPDVTSLATGLELIEALVADRSVAPLGRRAAQAYDLEAEDSPWRSICCLFQGVSDHLLGDPAGARSHLEQGVRRSAVASPHVETLCLSQLAVIAVEEGDWDNGIDLIARAVRQVERHGLSSYPTAALTFAVSADVRAHAGSVDEGKRDARHAAQLLGRLSDFIPWYEAETRIMLARAALRLADVTAARALLAEASRLARRVPDAVIFGGWLEDTWELLDSAAIDALAGPSTLTMAELRILRFLPTHLSFREIGLRLRVSTNTVKTQAHAVYRKLEVSSRSEAVARASSIGLLEA